MYVLCVLYSTSAINDGGNADIQYNSHDTYFLRIVVFISGKVVVCCCWILESGVELVGVHRYRVVCAVLYPARIALGFACTPQCFCFVASWGSPNRVPPPFPPHSKPGNA